MSEKDETIGIIMAMLQQMDMREVDLVWRFTYGLSGRKETES